MSPLFILMPPPSGAEGQGGMGGMLVGLLPFFLIFAIFYFLVIRPQAKRQRETQAMLASLKQGDRVVTSGGLYGTVMSVKSDAVVVLKIADQVKVEVAKASITGITEKSREA